MLGIEVTVLIQLKRDLARQIQGASLREQDGHLQESECLWPDQKKHGKSPACYLDHIPSGSGRSPGFVVACHLRNGWSKVGSITGDTGKWTERRDGGGEVRSSSEAG